jgi:hypothetical protein
MASNSVLVGRPHYGHPGEVHTTQRNPLGMERYDERGGIYVYLKGVASTVNGTWVTYDEAHLTTRAVAGSQGRVAVATAAVVANQYGWYQVAGSVDALCLTGFADNGHVYLTATDGSIDDAATDDFVVGAIGRSDRDATTGMATFELNRPFVQNAGAQSAAGLAGATVTMTGTTLVTPTLTTPTITTPTITDPAISFSIATQRYRKVGRLAWTGDAIAAASGFAAWQNPESGDILIDEVILHVTTVSSGACTFDIGTTAVSAVTTSDNIFDGLDMTVSAPVIYAMRDASLDSGANIGVKTLASGKWITIDEKSGDAEGAVGTLFVYYHDV